MASADRTSITAARANADQITTMNESSSGSTTNAA